MIVVEAYVEGWKVLEKRPQPLSWSVSALFNHGV